MTAENVPPPQIGKGIFLIASPELDAGLFFRAVILICEHNMNGSFGIVINKPLDFELPDEMVSLGNIVNPNVTMRASGPVQTNQMMLLHTQKERAEQILEICDGVYLGGDLQFLQEMLSDETGPPIQLCFGYAGWTGGQLEREFLDGSWFIHPANEEYIFNTPHEKLWNTLLRDMGGKYATLSMIPDDLSVN
ncbi:MAG: YqgE/AlgH family protein [Verrucomicrobia bacterium]|nr:YqgE/AlgH family protein [Verrucomicrobiota bacterium]